MIRCFRYDYGKTTSFICTESYQMMSVLARKCRVYISFESTKSRLLIDSSQHASPSFLVFLIAPHYSLMRDRRSVAVAQALPKNAFDEEMATFVPTIGRKFQLLL